MIKCFDSIIKVRFDKTKLGKEWCKKAIKNWIFMLIL